MKVSGQLQAPALLLPGEQPPVPTEQEAGWAPEPALTFGKEKNLFPMPAIEPRSSNPYPSP